jgi:hypothetical protein
VKYYFNLLLFIVFLEIFFPWVRGDRILAKSEFTPCSLSRSQPTSSLCADSLQPTHLQKITFDLEHISPEGLIGKGDGLRSQSYEFCIPDRAPNIAEVKAIDPSLKLYRSRGRIGCRNDQWVAIGDTHQPHWKQILFNLACLDYIERIDPFWGE